MKKWFKLHKKQIFAIICVLMLSLSCVTFVSAAEPDQYYPYYDFTICGIAYSDLLGSFACVPYYYDAYAEYENDFTYNGTDTIGFAISTSFSLNYFEFNCTSYGLTGQPYGASSLSFYDFYLSPGAESRLGIIECAFALSGGSIADDVVADIYYSDFGSEEIIHKTINLETLETNSVSILLLEDFPEYLNGVYVHSLILSTDSTLTAGLENISCTVYTGWSDRSVDIERAEGNNGGGILVSLFDVFTSVTQWLVNSLVTVVSLFFVNGKFTVIGILSIIATGISIVLLLISIITAYLRFGR